ncbi:MAG: toll/interleukin-1 receptor domain-containing protein [Gammaproteobacteria bacterium]|nr:toll/interleukin-1 receptor domain-containing protein [Gammaproteobacteria bacterium]
MSSPAAGSDASAASRFLIRLLDRDRHADLLLALAVGTWPVLFAWLIGAHRTIGDHVGYWDSHTWVLAPVFPILLYAFRALNARVIPVGRRWPPAARPPIIELLRGETAQAAVYARLRDRILAPINLWIPLAASVIVHVLDAPYIFEPYLGTPSTWPSWVSMFEVAPEIGRGMNLLLVLSAGLIQFAIVFIGLLAITLFFRHNLFFLRNVYQRRWVQVGDEACYFQVDPKDVNRCFGFRAANVAFNTQVRALMIAGAAIFLSRYGVLVVNAKEETDFLRFPPTVPDFDALFPLPSQWIMALSWLIALAVVALPALVKLLPRLGDRGEHSVADFLGEYFADSAWPRDRLGGKAPLPVVAAWFARNSFWPTGDNRAGVLFFFAYWIFLLTLVPVSVNNLALLLMIAAATAVLAYAAQLLTFKALRLSLHFVDEMLVSPTAGAERDGDAADDAAANDVSIFISYRRRDTAAYARTLSERLSEAFSADHVFVDIRDIAPGEDFVQRIGRTLDAVDTVVVLIGDRWLSLTDGDGRRRLDDPDDVVRLEIATALERGKRVIPVLVGDARMPSADELPDPLRPLALRNAVELSETRWDYDIGRLIDTLRRA